MVEPKFSPQQLNGWAANVGEVDRTCLLRWMFWLRTIRKVSSRMIPSRPTLTVSARHRWGSLVEVATQTAPVASMNLMARS